MSSEDDDDYVLTVDVYEGRRVIAEVHVPTGLIPPIDFVHSKAALHMSLESRYAAYITTPIKARHLEILRHLRPSYRRAIDRDERRLFVMVLDQYIRGAWQPLSERYLKVGVFISHRFASV